MKSVLAMIAIVLALAGLRCSVVDGDDRAMLESELAAIRDQWKASQGGPYADLQVWAAHKAITKHLSSHSLGAAIGGIICTPPGADVDPDPTFSGDDDLTMEVHDMLRCMSGGLDYVRCMEIWRDVALDAIHQKKKYAALANQDCRWMWRVEYEPDRVAADIMSDNQYTIGDTYRQMASRFTVHDIADALIASPTPPPLPGAFGALRPLLPILCGLGAGWGCPDNPLYPDQQPGSSSSTGADR